LLVCFWFFFFQAEDGIRVFHVTGVQTCALPISPVGARSALRTREFWLLSVGHGNALAIVGAVSVHFVIYVGETIGLGVTTAAAMFTLITVCQVAGQAAGGFLGDRYDKRFLAAGGMAMHAAAMVVLVWAGS